jgi:hypothetical protein
MALIKIILIIRLLGNGYFKYGAPLPLPWATLGSLGNHKCEGKYGTAAVVVRTSRGG